MSEGTAVAERPKIAGAQFTIDGVNYYGEGPAADYLGLSRDNFKKHLRKRPDALPFLTQPASGRRAWTEETLGAYRDEWLKPV